MEPKQEEWINQVLGSLEGIQRTEPSPFLFAKIRDRLEAKPVPVHVPVRVIWLTVASFVLLLLLNWRVINPSSQLVPSHDQDLKAVISDMKLYPVSTEFYDVWSEQNY